MYDNAEISVRAGNGGDGAVSFRREKFVPLGGPDGGDGGMGGDVLLAADQSVSSLRLFRQNRLYRAGDGASGKAKKKKGKKGNDLVLRVPVGTIIWDLTGTPADAKETGQALQEEGHDAAAMVADLSQQGQEAVVARGGKGGAGNVHFATSTNQAPRIAQKGETGQEKMLRLELRLIADVGIIGFPNVGKSSLLAAASNARPKIAPYPFTTLEPVPGVVESGSNTFVLAEVPGLIDGAHAGRGLGSEFLRHALRTRLLIHLVDGSSASPVEDLFAVNTELRLYDGGLAGKPQVIAVNKIDIPDVRQRVDDIRRAFAEAGETVLFVSAATGEGVPELMAQAAGRLRQVMSDETAASREPAKVFRPQPRMRTEVHKEGEVFVINSSEIERIAARVDTKDPEVLRQLRGRMDRIGVGRMLARMGVKRGDRVRCGPYEWDW